MLRYLRELGIKHEVYDLTIGKSHWLMWRKGDHTNYFSMGRDPEGTLELLGLIKGYTTAAEQPQQKNLEEGTVGLSLPKESGAPVGPEVHGSDWSRIFIRILTGLGMSLGILVAFGGATGGTPWFTIANIIGSVAVGAGATVYLVATRRNKDEAKLENRARVERLKEEEASLWLERGKLERILQLRKLRNDNGEIGIRELDEKIEAITAEIKMVQKRIEKERETPHVSGGRL